MSPILKRDLCFIAKYAAIGLIMSVGIATTVFSGKHTSYHAATASTATAVTSVRWEATDPLALTVPTVRVVGYTPH